MAKSNVVGKEVLRAPSVPDTYWEVEVTLDKKSKHFEINIPKHIADATDHNSISAKSYDLAVSGAREVWYQYLTATVKNTKVIRYIYAKSIQGNMITSSPTLIRTNYGIGISYEVGWKIDIGANSFFCRFGDYEEYMSNKRNQTLQKIETHSVFDRHNHYVYKEWTPELELFFENTVNALVNLIERVDDFFGENGQHLLENIKTNQKLL